MKIAISNLNKSYGLNHVLKDINLDLEYGVYGLIGPNGVGKTTLLHIILAILDYDSGSIEVDHHIEHGGGDFIRTVGYLPQYPKFYPSFTAIDFLRYICVLKDIDSELIEPKVEELLHQVNLYSRRDDKIETFSGGMIQRLGIAQALVNDPKILILDEPTAGLDPKERIRFRNIISKLSKEKIIIFSSHIISDIEYIADEIILIKDGRIEIKETQENILKNIAGSIQELIVSEEELENLSNETQITRITTAGSKYKIRIISQKHIGEIVTPNIEDIYMYYFGDKDEKNDIF